MYLNVFPNEILHSILQFASEANIKDGVTCTFGLGLHTDQPLKNPNHIGKYPRGPVPPTLLRWDGTASIREVCKQWRDWSLGYIFRDVYVRRWRGDERWADLTMQRSSYAFFEMNQAISGAYVRRSAHQTLNKTQQFLQKWPHVATNVRKLWFDGLHLPETDKTIIEIMYSCNHLTNVTLPWTMLRHGTAHDWRQILGTSRDLPLETLKLHAIQLPAAQAKVVLEVADEHPLDSAMVNFSRLKHLKLFGDTQVLPINDDDLKAIARTATQLEDFQITCMSTVTLNGVMAVVKASRNTLRLLEHSPRAQDGFSHPHPGVYSEKEHICDILTSCPKLEDLSISLPSMCADLFSNDRVIWSGDCQVRALHLCGHEDGDTSNDSVSDMKTLLSQARHLIRRRAVHRFPAELRIELFFSDLIFDPHLESVHGDFSIAELATQNAWPVRPKMISRKGPYGTTGLYGKDEEHPFDRLSEDEFFLGVARNYVRL